MLDSGRYRTFIAMELGLSVRDVNAWVLGGHTEATMVPLVSNATVGGVPITSLLPPDRVQAVVERTKGGGAEIVGAAEDRQRLHRARRRHHRDGASGAAG